MREAERAASVVEFENNTVPTTGRSVIGALMLVAMAVNPPDDRVRSPVPHRSPRTIILDENSSVNRLLV